MLRQLVAGVLVSKGLVKRLTSLDYVRDLLFLLSLAYGILTLAALISYAPKDPSFTSYYYPTVAVENLVGRFGAFFGGFLVFSFGVTAFLTPLPFIVTSFRYLKGHQTSTNLTQIFGWLLFFIAACCAIQVSFGVHLFGTIPHNTGGALGAFFAQQSAVYFGEFGKWLIYAFLAVSGLTLVFKKPFSRAAVRRSQNVLVKKKQTSQNTITHDEPDVTQQPIIASPPIVHPPLEIKAKVETDVKAGEEGAKQDKKPAINVASYIPALMKDPLLRNKNKKGEDSSVSSEPVEALTKSPSYEPPSTSIFKKTAVSQNLSDQQREEFKQTAEQLKAAFAEFQVFGKVIAIQPGPVVAVYEFQPEAGTKLSKVTGLIEDIALALKVDSIFIHPVSGKRALGVQVPNKTREMVYLGDIVTEPVFKSGESPLTFAMGKNLSGDAICEDLAKMPHLLVAGQTGSGKSVAINSLLCSLILKSKPEEVKMVLVDPKILELKIYEGIPHLLMPVITEAAKASLALKWACYEMDRRYKLMELAKVRQITGFNQYWSKASAAEKDQIERISEQKVSGKLPYIVVVIDELADLMLTAPKDVESSIQRLAQKARASGIHLVLATQRPSVDVITGVIKANLPCRLSFKVFSRGDSRTILDAMGAERLLGKGDMLFLKPGTSRLQRLQGAFLEDHEVLEMVEEIKTEDGSSYDETAISWIEDEFEKQAGSGSDDGGLDSDGEDVKWDAAIAVAQKQGSISASYLQRSLKIGYNRAARIVEHMESQGLVGPADGSKPRKWLGPV